ncbi:hypothetical protein RND81_06G072700 [Saponaria officinalis]|uniref:CCHC-type domain-containing protein n=1 Tax=Saponaria officinalis TaxID=3572 RepID=A0AAW1K904_SAPOF
MPPKKTSEPAVMTQETVDRLLEANATLTEAVRALTKEKTETVTAASMSAALARHSPPEFDGIGGPTVLEDWLRKFEKLFITVGCPEELKVDQAACYLKSRADTWWYDNQDHLRLYHDAVAIGEDEFGWATFETAKRMKFDYFRQREGTTVEEYYIEFMELASYATDLTTNSEMMATRFERGLALHILEKLPAGVPTTVREMYLKAGYAQRLCDMRREARAEKRKSEGGDGRDFRAKRGNFSGSVNRGAFSGDVGRGAGSVGRNQACRRCSRVHIGRTCGRMLTCYECGKPEHKAFECFRRTGVVVTRAALSEHPLLAREV